MNRVSRLISAALRGLVRFYQLTISPLLGGQCRFVPSCSQYALDALAAHGPAAGSWLAARRICRCHPFHPGGFDPVPAPISPFISPILSTRALHCCAPTSRQTGHSDG